MLSEAVNLESSKICIKIKIGNLTWGKKKKNTALKSCGFFFSFCSRRSVIEAVYNRLNPYRNDDAVSIFSLTFSFSPPQLF